MKPRRSLIIIVIFTAAVCTSGQVTRDKLPSKNAAGTESTPQHAKWEPFWESLYGITETEFNEAGLNHLTTLQSKTLSATLLKHRPTFSCGPSFGPKELDEYHYVHLHVSGPDSDAAFVGLLRSKLAAIRDVRMVPSDENADLSVTVLTVKNEVGAREIGLTVSTGIYESCVYQPNGWLGNGSTQFKRLIDALLNAGNTDDAVATRIANTVEAREFDDVRTNHAQILKVLQE